MSMKQCSKCWGTGRGNDGYGAMGMCFSCGGTGRVFEATTPVRNTCTKRSTSNKQLVAESFMERKMAADGLADAEALYNRAVSENSSKTFSRSMSSDDVAMWVGVIVGVISTVLVAEWFGGDFVGDDSDFGYADGAVSVAIWLPISVGSALAIRWIISLLHIIVPVAFGAAVFGAYMDWL